MSMPDIIYVLPYNERNAAGQWCIRSYGDDTAYYSEAKYKALEARIDELLEQQKQKLKSYTEALLDNQIEATIKLCGMWEKGDFNGSNIDSLEAAIRVSRLSEIWPNIDGNWIDK